jgi:transposase
MSGLSKKQALIAWRRNQVIELLARGHNEDEAASILKVGRATVYNDERYLTKQARESIETYVTDKIPFEHRKTLKKLELIEREAWTLYNGTDQKDRHNKIMILSLLKDTAINIDDLMANSEIISSSQVC